MNRIATWLVFGTWLLPATAPADQAPARGKLLVATEFVQGELFAETVVLLLHYNEHGAMGIVVNRPTEIDPEEILADVDAIPDYDGAIYWGGPVEMYSLRALQRTDSPPEGLDAIVGSVHLVPIDESLRRAPRDPESLRLFIGYAGWSPGQLDNEIEFGSWHIVQAAEEHVFAKDPRTLWKELSPPSVHRAAARVR